MECCYFRISLISYYTIKQVIFIDLFRKDFFNIMGPVIEIGGFLDG